MANIIKVTFISYVASDGDWRQKIEHYPTEKHEAYYKDRVSSGEPELWEIVDENLDPNGVFILVPNGAISEGEQLLMNYLTNKFKGWDLGFTNNG
jgi:hypothetical protein